MKLKRYLNLLLSPLKIEIISIAIKIKLFDLLQEALSVEDIQKELNFSTYNTKIFLDALVHLKLLKHKDTLYKNSSFSKKYFVSFSKYYMGDVFLYRQEYLGLSQEQILKLLKSKNREKMELQNPKVWAKASKKYFYQEQKILLSDFVIDTVKQINKSKNIKKVLDIGCSSGVVTLELLKANSDFEAVLFDFEDVIKETKKNIKNYNLNKRASTLCGDVQKDDIKNGYDLVICSNILHLLEQKEKVLQKIYQSLNKNGILFIVQSNILDFTEGKNSYFYNLIPRLYDEDYSKKCLFADTLLSAGFRNVDSFKSNKLLAFDAKIFIARR